MYAVKTQTWHFSRSHDTKKVAIIISGDLLKQPRNDLQQIQKKNNINQKKEGNYDNIVENPSHKDQDKIKQSEKVLTKHHIIEPYPSKKTMQAIKTLQKHKSAVNKETDPLLTFFPSRKSATHHLVQVSTMK
jgi:hypothetical protein